MDFIMYTNKFCYKYHCHIILFIVYIQFVKSINSQQNLTTIKHKNVTDNIINVTTTDSKESSSTTVASQNEIISGVLQSQGYPDCYYSNGSFTFSKSFPNGYQIDIIVQDLDLESNHNDYLLIRSGTEKNVDGQSFKLIVHLNESKHFRTVSSSFFIEFKVEDRDSDQIIEHRGFYLQWKRIGNESTTTTEIPSTTEIIPPDQYEYIVVYITGDITPDEFVKNKISYFIDQLVIAANQYCNNMKIPITEKITNKNINIVTVTQCSITWPNSVNCIHIKFAIPVHFDNSTSYDNSTYELNEAHLNDMWSQYNDQILTNIGMKLYTVPNFQINQFIWISVFILLTILFSTLLFILWRYDFFDTDIRKRRLSETNSFYNDDKPKRASDLSLNLSPHQLVPPLFDTPKQPLTDDDPDYDFNCPNNSFPLYETDDLNFAGKSMNLKKAGSSQVTFNHGFDNLCFNDDEHVIFQHPGESLTMNSKNLSNHNEIIQTDSML